MSTIEIKPEKKGVQISKATGGAYIDIREVIESELERICNEDTDVKRIGVNEDIRSHVEKDDDQLDDQPRTE